MHEFDRVIVATNDYAACDKLLPDNFSAKTLAADLFSRLSYHEAWSMVTNNASLVPEELHDARTGCWNLEAYTNVVRNVTGNWQVAGSNFDSIDTTRCYR